jgi:DNA mismatch repair ATPase MutL
VDVNIHPSKREVKLQFSDRVIGLIGRAVRTALSNSSFPVPSDERLSEGTSDEPTSLS